MTLTEFLKLLNDCSGLTILLSVLTFWGREFLKKKNTIDINNSKFKTDNIGKKTLEMEAELYSMMSDFSLAIDFSEENCSKVYEEIRIHIIDNSLFLREKLSKIGEEFSEYIIEDVSKGNKNIKKQKVILKKYIKAFRS